jgi:alkylation response protein AidB-like acyl-CoA dehydrogenase
VSECYKWAIQRKAFGKRLIDQPVIRYKLAEMSAIVECLDAWLESVTFQMDSMTPMEQFENLSSTIALMKFQIGKYGWTIADNAAQILGPVWGD